MNGGSEISAIAITVVTVVFVLWINSQKTPWIKKILDWFPAILFAYVIPAAITHITGWDLSGVYLHSVSREWIIPLAILAVMSALSLRQLKIVGLRPIVLFVFGSFVIACLPVVLVLILSVFGSTGQELFIEQQYWKGLVPIVGGWIGGSTSQLVLKELVRCPEALFLAVLVLDNILVNIWTILMFQFIQRSDQLNRFFHIDDRVPDFVPDTVDLSKKKLRNVVLTILFLGVVIIIGNSSVHGFLERVVLYSVIGLLLGNVLKWWNHTVVLKLGGILIITIMAILGLRLNFASFSLPYTLVILVIVWLLLHFIFMLGCARLLKLHMAWVPIASMANLGGISTAPAVTAAYNEEWMPHAILLAILSMVSGTGWGMVTMWLFGLL